MSETARAIYEKHVSCRIVNKCVNTPDLPKHYKIRVNRALAEAKRTKCTRSAEEMRFYANVLNSSKHVPKTYNNAGNTIKHEKSWPRNE